MKEYAEEHRKFNMSNSKAIRSVKASYEDSFSRDRCIRRIS